MPKGVLIGKKAEIKQEYYAGVIYDGVRKLPTFRGEAAFPTWLHRVTVNAALCHRRRKAVRQQFM